MPGNASIARFDGIDYYQLYSEIAGQGGLA